MLVYSVTCTHFHIESLHRKSRCFSVCSLVWQVNRKAKFPNIRVFGYQQILVIWIWSRLCFPPGLPRHGSAEVLSVPVSKLTSPRWFNNCYIFKSYKIELIIKTNNSCIVVEQFLILKLGYLCISVYGHPKLFPLTSYVPVLRNVQTFKD